eukprot:CAMPEP_0197695864 /NCGR_PEP_ID=MMETSP1338-20131121/115805_1 /TAXON_ID=43686 ORGANISM="Pelagodinium beii, Strain RCC1491" /NCGR_SAMPLE_ID=MMETSP1338 /ASSEMBLY_ACC=CAM_ASM_000754 /LENGTH=164 /DNA_ID=CAMNT_0043278907 /DNA_START=141 /DNA_END=632 /DNA_ORIENTATION=+
MPVLHLLEAKECGVLIIATATWSYVGTFVQHLGFEPPGRIIFDSERKTHKVCGLQSSIYASLVEPFRKHLRTFGRRALWEALYVSLKNATAGHGSSWQQGGTFLLEHETLRDVKCSLAWREEYPGDWKPIHEILKEGLGIEAPPVSFPERLDYVIQARKTAENE